MMRRKFEKVSAIAGNKTSRALAHGGAAVATAEDGGKNALHVRVDIGSLEVS